MLLQPTKTGYLLLLLLMTVTFRGYAQNFKEDIKKMNLAYKDAAISSEVKYEYFAAYEAPQATSIETAVISMKEGKYYMKMGKIELFKNATLSMYVNHEEKEITLMAPDKSTPSMEMLNVNLEEVAKVSQKIEYKKEGKVSQYILTMPEDTKYKSIKISFYNQTFLLDKMEFLYNEMVLEEEGEVSKPRMVISYKNNKNVDDAVFSCSGIIKLHNGKYVVQEKYRNYKLNSHL